ncbi:MAG: 3-deoxy-manno-octulosonate cytidylyltransferase (CMP-KDO synthetase) [Rhodocyclaceae bacterium]|nr:MAG: 3-deoxy-manno-octulosonate cytidylyltransferase (CMP-KDO synthetase) [Rhodocyclaceae bacterium]
MNQAIGIIPARYGSTRLPAKALATLNGIPLIQHVYQQARKAAQLTDVVVATDDERIARVVEGFGGRAIMTDAHHRSGTDRVAEVARQRDEQVILNIQGDEPLIHPDQIDQVVKFLLDHRAVPMATVMTRLTRCDDAANPNVVKVVVDQDGYALYFSRSPIPFTGSRVKGQGSRDEQTPSPFTLHPSPSYKHIGLYGYQREFLLRFPHLAPTPLEQAEQLEQLRALEHGYQIRVLETAHDTVGVDTADDLKRAEQALVQR